MLLHQRVEHDPLERLIVLGEDEVAVAFAHLVHDRRELAAHVVHVLAPDRELGFELRIVRAETELDAAVRRHLFDSRKQRIRVRFADAI